MKMAHRGEARRVTSQSCKRSQTREAILWALEAAALNPEVIEFKTGVLQT